MFDLITQPETGRQFRTVTLDNGEILTQDRPAGRGYRVTDPLDLKAKLEPYFECKLITGLMQRRNHVRSAFVAGLECRERTGVGEYKRVASILCANDGKHSLRIRRGALRCSCANQFHSGQVGWRHNDPHLDEFLTDPAGVLFNVMAGALDVAEKVESLEYVTRGAQELVNAISLARPKLGAKVWDALPTYHQHGELSLWAVLQAVTAPHNATLEGLAGLALGPGWQELRRGLVPACVERALR